MNHASLLWYVGAFAVALGVLIVFHELGHYLVARLLGVKVLRFSLGFGKPLLMRRFGVDGTEWSLAAFPLGGYVKMLDEREGPVAAAELPRAFNRQRVWRRALIVVAGPVANLLLAVLIYWALFMHGVDEMRPVLAAPPAASPAAQAGIEEGEQVRAVSGKVVTTLQDFRWQLMQCIVDGRPARLEVINPRGEIALRTLATASVNAAELDADITHTLGLAPYRPKLKPIVGAVAPGSVAEAGGMLAGDEVTAIDGKPIENWNELAAAIRAAPGRAMAFVVRRDGARHDLRLVPRAETEAGQTIGRIGIGVRDDPEARARLMVLVRLGPVDALAKAVRQTWDTSVFSLRMIGRMLVGELSWRNISGPVTIADYAGQSAQLGLDHYLKFLALISISLGVLNLLPIPILDGGHLLYYLVEVIKGGPLSERVMEIGQQIGLGLLALLMAFAFYNDINRLISG
jgi:regulator of sigma E protease